MFFFGPFLRAGDAESGVLLAPHAFSPQLKAGSSFQSGQQSEPSSSSSSRSSSASLRACLWPPLGKPSGARVLKVTGREAPPPGAVAPALSPAEPAMLPASLFRPTGLGAATTAEAAPLRHSGHPLPPAAERSRGSRRSRAQRRGRGWGKPGPAPSGTPDETEGGLDRFSLPAAGVPSRAKEAGRARSGSPQQPGRGAALHVSDGVPTAGARLRPEGATEHMRSSGAHLRLPPSLQRLRLESSSSRAWDPAAPPPKVVQLPQSWRGGPAPSAAFQRLRGAKRWAKG